MADNKLALMVRTARESAVLAVDTWPDERILAIANTCAPAEASPYELGMFLAVADRYQLDPLIGEIWLVKDKGKLIVVTGRDSFVRIAARDPDYLGLDYGIVYEGDDFMVERGGGEVTIKHVRGQFGTPPVGAYACVRHKRLGPSFYDRPWGYYKHLLTHAKKENWQKYPHDMVETRVITAAFRRLYPLAGLYTPEDFVQGRFNPETGETEPEGLEDLAARLEKAGRNIQVAVTELQEAEVVEAPDYETVEEEEEAPEPRGERTGLTRKELENLYREKVKEIVPEWLQVPDGPLTAKLWQEQTVGKADRTDWTLADYELAVRALERGEIDVEIPVGPLGDEEGPPV